MFKMSGVVSSPMITPFDKDGNLDEKGLKVLVGYLKNKNENDYYDKENLFETTTECM